MQSILLEHDVRLEIGLTRPASSVTETSCKSIQRAAIQSDHLMRTQALTGQSEPDSALASACGKRCMRWYKPIIIMLLNDAAYDTLGPS